MKRTDFPYIVTLLFAFFSWTVAHAIDRLIALPLVKLTQTIVERADHNHLTIEFETITSSVNFENLNIRILGKTSEDQFSPPTTTVIGRGWDGKASLFTKGDGIRLEIRNFHPGWRLRLTTDMTGGGAPGFSWKARACRRYLNPLVGEHG